MMRKKIRNSEIAEELGLPPVKVHCSVLAEDAIKAAIADVKNKRGYTQKETLTEQEMQQQQAQQ